MTTQPEYQAEHAIDAEISQRINAAMFRQRVTARKMAAAVGIHPSSWTHRMQGSRPWRAEEVVRAAAALGVPAATLLPHLDSNQEPSDYRPVQVTALPGRHLRQVDRLVG